MKQLSLRRVLLSVTCLSVGMAIFALLGKLHRQDLLLIYAILFVVGIMAIATAIGCLIFDRWNWPAAIVMLLLAPFAVFGVMYVRFVIDWMDSAHELSTNPPRLPSPPAGSASAVGGGTAATPTTLQIPK